MNTVYYAAVACIALSSCATHCADKEVKKHTRETRAEWASPPASPSSRQVQAPPRPTSPSRVPTPPPVKKNELVPTH